MAKFPSLACVRTGRGDQSDAFFFEPLDPLLELSDLDGLDDSDFAVDELEDSEELDLESPPDPSLEDLLSAAADFLYESLR